MEGENVSQQPNTNGLYMVYRWMIRLQTPFLMRDVH